MDAVKYLGEAMRMCNSIESCEKCPFERNSEPGEKVCFPCKSYSESLERTSPEKVIAIVEKWSDEHPRKTRQNEFLKMHPDTKKNSDGVLVIKPCHINKKIMPTMCRPYYKCSDCLKDYWLAEVE